MKNFFFLFLLIFLACQGNSGNDAGSVSTTPEGNTVDPVIEEPTRPDITEQPAQAEPDLSKAKETRAEVKISTPADYSDHFIEDLKKMKGIQKAEVQGNLMVLDQTDSIPFPEYPVMGKNITLSAKKDKLTIALQVRRVNQSSITYDLKMTEEGKPTYSQKGTADVSPYFYLGSESDVDEISGESFFTTEYYTKNDTCYAMFRIGKMDDKKSDPYLCKIIKNCNGDLREIDLDNFPVLREQ